MTSSPLRASLGIVGLGMAAAVMALQSAAWDDTLGPSNTERVSDEQRRRAKAEREKWGPVEGESRQVRRTRERREAKR